VLAWPQALLQALRRELVAILGLGARRCKLSATMTVTIRPASVDDAEAITTVYNQGIIDRGATLETALRTPAERREWLTRRGPRHPVVVAEANGAVVAWASLNQFNPRQAYDHVADFSIYVERHWRGKGVGGTLLNQLIALARSLGYHKMVLVALPHNEAGLALYARAGFTRVGIYHEQGQLDGRWVDVLVMERIL
jgi:L-amino acid N-acyltransferase YncA